MRILTIVHQADAGPGIFAEAIAEAGHQLEVWEPPQGNRAPDPRSYAAVLTFGGEMHPDQDEAHPWLAEERRLLARALGHEIPLLAVCLGAELLAEAAGARAGRASSPEIGWYPVRLSREAGSDPVLGKLRARFDALEWHSYASELPPGAVALAASETCLQAYRVGRLAWGIQFHAEVTLETFESWLDSYDQDPDAVKLGIEPEALRAQTRSAIQEWNRIGYDICTRFLEVANSVRRRDVG